MLDPIKFGIVCPGMKDDGQLDEKGIPADIVTAYIGRHGIVPSRTTDHMVLFLFSIGVTKGKWGTLLNTLLDFKVDYDRNAPLAEVLPGLVAQAPHRYAGKGLKDLGDEMWAQLRKSKQGHWQTQAYATLPTPKMTPRRAFQKLMAGDAEKVPLDKMADRVVTVGVIPYPPGIPIVMPGESLGPQRRSVDHLPAHAAGVEPHVSGICQGSGGHRRGRRCVPRALREVATELTTERTMLDFAARIPTIPIPFHKLLKVVALVDGANPQVGALIERLRAENIEVEISDRYASRRLRGCRSGRVHRLRRRRAARAGARARRRPYATADFKRRCGRWRTRAASPTCPCWAWSAKSMASSISGSRHRVLRQAGLASLTSYGMSLLPPFFGGLMAYDSEAKISFACPGHQGGEFYRKSPAGPALLQALRRADLPQ